MNQVHIPMDIGKPSVLWAMLPKLNLYVREPIMAKMMIAEGRPLGMGQPFVFSVGQVDEALAALPLKPEDRIAVKIALRDNHLLQ